MTAATATVGATKRLTFTFLDTNSPQAPADPGTIALTIREPDGVETTKAKADMTQDSTGIWHYDFTVTKEGRHNVLCDGSGVADAATQIEFYAFRKTTT